MSSRSEKIGDVSLTFNPDGHVYRVRRPEAGKDPAAWQVVSSVTQILAALYPPPPISRERLADLAEIGTAAHAGAEAVVCASISAGGWIEPDEITDTVEALVALGVVQRSLLSAALAGANRLVRTARILDWEPLETERMVFSHRYWYAGRCDLIVRNRKGRRVLVDIKSGSAISKRDEAQVGGYALACREPENPDIDDVAVLYLKIRRAANPRLYEIPRERAEERFTAVLQAYEIDRALSFDGPNYEEV